MTDFVTGARFRGAIGLIAAYAIALQTLFATLAPIPVNAQGADFSGWHVLCFGSGSTAAQDDPASPAPASGKFHCVLCAFAQASAIIPADAAIPAPVRGVSIVLFAPEPELAPAPPAIRAGSARAPPLSA